MPFADLERYLGVLEANCQNESSGSSAVDQDWKADMSTFFRGSAAKVMVYPFEG